MSEEPKFLSPGEMTDQQLAIGELRALMRDFREDMRWLREELAPSIRETKHDVASLRRDYGELVQRVAALEAARKED